MLEAQAGSSRNRSSRRAPVCRTRIDSGRRGSSRVCTRSNCRDMIADGEALLAVESVKKPGGKRYAEGEDRSEDEPAWRPQELDVPRSIEAKWASHLDKADRLLGHV